MNLLLDTCTFIWVAGQLSQLSPAARAAIENDANGLFVSQVSQWEVTTKYASGRLPLPAPPREWLPRQLALYPIDVLPISEEAIYLSGELPMVHRDPFDRLLAAQALAHGLVLVSPDRALRKLGAAAIW